MDIIRLADTHKYYFFLILYLATCKHTETIKMAGLWARYNMLLEAQPLLTKALTSLTGFTAGDVLAQKFVERGNKAYGDQG